MRIQGAVSPLLEKYVDAEKGYHCAELYLAKKEYAAAIAALKSALKIVGYSYAPDILDDSGPRIVFAELEEKKGNLEQAAGFLRTVLRDRLDLLRKQVE
jgi:tetratricopeptide (TPR) repeat protein